METKTIITTHVEDLDPNQWGWMYFCQTNDKDEVVMEGSVQEHYEEAAKYYGVSVDLLKDIEAGISYGVEALQERLVLDLKDIWKKITDE